MRRLILRLFFTSFSFLLSLREINEIRRLGHRHCHGNFQLFCLFLIASRKHHSTTTTTAATTTTHYQCTLPRLFLLLLLSSPPRRFCSDILRHRPRSQRDNPLHNLIVAASTHRILRLGVRIVHDPAVHHPYAQHVEHRLRRRELEALDTAREAAVHVHATRERREEGNRV